MFDYYSKIFYKSHTKLPLTYTHFCDKLFLVFVSSQQQKLKKGAVSLNHWERLNMNIMLMVMLLLVSALCIGVLSVFICRIMNEFPVGKRILVCAIMSLGFLSLISGVSHQYGYDWANESADKSSLGSPISLANGKYEGKTLKPIGVMVSGEEILLIDTDRNLYHSLLGTVLEKGLSPTNMVGNELILYRKGGAMYIGIKEPEVHSIPSGHYPTNNVEK